MSASQGRFPLPWIEKAAVASFACLLMVAGTACPIGESADYWTSLEAEDGTNPCVVTDIRTLSPDCAAALESNLPFDETWEDAPAGLKSDVLRAYQTLATLELDLPPDGTLFGVAENALPVQHACLLDAFYCSGIGGESADAPSPADAPRRAFNYVLNQVDVITYKADPPEGQSWDASYHGFAFVNRVMSIYSNFAGTGPLAGAALLMHESHHGDGYTHVECLGPGGQNCDADLNGPYGIGASYIEMALRADYRRSQSEEGLFNRPSVRAAGNSLCWMYMTRFRNLPAILRLEVTALVSCDLATEDVLEQLGLEDWVF